MYEIKQSEVTNMTKATGRLLAAELKTQATAIAQARQTRTSLPTDENTYDIKASMNELDLMRKLLAQNAAKTRGAHRQGLIGPWHASFVESLLRETELTQQSGINLHDEVINLFCCHTCERLPPNPEK